MTKRPFFSLITPVYNIEKLLAATIESALGQTFADWEMILVDDGSPDNAGAVCDEYVAKDFRIHVVHKQNEGLAEARNVGIREATGKYFLILEGSDVFPGNTVLERVHGVLSQKPVDIYFGKLRDVMEGSGEVFGEQKDYCVNGFVEGGKKLFVTLFENEDVLALSSPVNKFFRTDFVKEKGLWFCKGIYHDDDEWLPRTISLSQSAYFTNEFIYDALTWDGCLGKAASDKSLTKKAVDKMFLALRCCRDMDERFPNERKTVFMASFFEYYFRIYQSGILALNEIKDADCKKQVRWAAKQYREMFRYAGYTTSKNLRRLALLKKFCGLGIATKLILKRYAK